MESFRIDLAIQFESLSDISYIPNQTLILLPKKLVFPQCFFCWWNSITIHPAAKPRNLREGGRKKIGCFHFLTSAMVSSKNQDSSSGWAILLLLQSLGLIFPQNQSQFSSHSFGKHDHFNNSQMAIIALWVKPKTFNVDLKVQTVHFCLCSSPLCLILWPPVTLALLFPTSECLQRLNHLFVIDFFYNFTVLSTLQTNSH